MATASGFHFVRAGKLHFFCPLCKHHQSTNTIERMKLKHHAQLGLFTAAVTLLGFEFFRWKGLSLYFIAWAVFEVAYRLRKRQALICESCGFDPFLYKQDVEKARKALRAHWEKKIEKENLFAGIKLKNYKTASVNKEDNTAAAAPISENENRNAPQLNS